jgi:hypothetical protein
MALEVIGLRCGRCGAPLPKPEKGSEYVKCEYCGYLQKMVDVSSYTEKLRSEIYNWIKQFLPISAITAQTTDPLARHHIFVAYIRPKIMPEYASVKAGVMRLLSTPLIGVNNIKINAKGDEPKEAFERLAKIESLVPMATIPEDQEFYNEVYSIYILNAYLSNYIMRSLEGDIDVAVKNLEKLTEALFGIEGKLSEYHRVKGLTDTLKAWSSMEKGDYASALTLLESALRDIEVSRNLSSKNPQLAIMLPALETEQKFIQSILNFSECGKNLFESGHQPQEIMVFLHKYFIVVESLRSLIGRDLSIYLELSEKIKSIFKSRLGKETVEILPGQGDIAVPFYVVTISYTFTTGSLIWKKGKEYKDYLMVLATSPYYSEVVTDTFRVRSGFLDRLKGREEKLTVDTVAKALTLIRRDYLNIPTLPPLIGMSTAERIVDDYLKVIDSRLHGKIKFGASQAEKLIYAVAKIHKDEIYIDGLGETQVSLGGGLGKLALHLLRI